MQQRIVHVSFIILIVMILSTYASHTFAVGRIKVEDFSYRNIVIGESEDSLRAKWGEPDIEVVRTIWGIHLKALTYGDTVVSTSIANHKVVDINLVGEKYRLRKDVHYGTTSSYLLKIYGKNTRQFLDGNICYVFSHPKQKHERLILNLDSENGSLISARITMLPLTDEEADERALSDDDSFVELDLNDGFIGAKEIDVSALPKNDNAQIGGYHK